MKKFITKNNLTKILCVTIILFLALSVFPSLFVNASTSQPINEIIEEVTISQNQFEGTVNLAPYEPSSWTGSYINTEDGNAVKGIITLNANYIENYDNIKLGIYPEYKNKNDIPLTPFGRTVLNPSEGQHFPNTNKNVLLINTNKSTTAFGYSSQEITLEANSFYRFSVYVKTGKFYDTLSGAAVTLTGLKEAVGIWNIDTTGYYDDVANDTLYGFRKYTINVATGNNSETVKLQLSVGDNIEEHIYLSNGYAFFDNVECVRYSPTPFYNTLVENGFSTYYNLNSNNHLLDSNSKDIGSFTNERLGWQRIVEKDADSNPIASLPMDFNVYNGGGEFYDSSAFGLVSDPATPRGKAQSDNNIMVLTSYDKTIDSFRPTRGGIISSDILIEKEKTYLLSVWFNTQEIEGSASIVISGESTIVSKGYKLDPTSNDALTSDNNTHRYGWQRKDFYIKGSMFKDVNINVELWLGRDENSKGIAMFDDITLDEIEYKQYESDSGNGTQLVIDSNTSTSSSTIANGYFDSVSFKEDEISYPLNPTSWTFNSTSTASVTGRSSFAVDHEDAVYGVVPTESNHYSQHKASYLNIENPYVHSYQYSNKNVLLMASEKNTAFCYTSSEMNIVANSLNEIKVRLLANMQGNGASLILKKANKIVSSIENITSTNNQFAEYKFYVEGANEDTALTLEIWFGFVDKEVNSSKLAKGYLFVDYADSTETSTDFNTLREEYDSYPENPSKFLNYAVYQMNGTNFSAFDRYSNEVLKEAYDFSLSKTGNVNYGIITGIPANQNIIPSYFNKANGLVENRFDNVLYLQNINEGYSKLTSSNTFMLEADNFYKIQFSALVQLGQESRNTSVGGGIHLNGEGFNDIKDTLNDGIVVGKDQIEYEYVFKTYTFYYAVGTESENVSWYISLGSDELPNNVVAGRMFVNSISIENIDPYYYNEELAELRENENQFFYELDRRAIVVEEVPPVETPNEESAVSVENNPWLLVPSIIFAIAILIVLVGVVVKKLLARRPVKKNKEKVVSYDRKRVSDEAEEKNVVVRDSLISLDDELNDEPRQIVKETKEIEQSETEAETTEEVKTTEDLDEFND